jgi:hypothetical protein
MMHFTSRLGRPYLATFLATAWALLLCAVIWPGRADAQKPRKALERDQVIELLESGVAPTRVAELARDYGIAFEITEQVETQLRDAGATDELLATLRELAPRLLLPAQGPRFCSSKPRPAARRPTLTTSRWGRQAQKAG